MAYSTDTAPLLPASSEDFHKAIMVFVLPLPDSKRPPCFSPELYQIPKGRHVFRLTSIRFQKAAMFFA